MSEDSIKLREQCEQSIITGLEQQIAAQRTMRKQAKARLKDAIKARAALTQLNNAAACPRCGARSQQEAEDGKCDGTGSDHNGPQCASWVGVWDENGPLRLVDYWCRDCQSYFRAPYQPDPWVPATVCPKGHAQTYETYRDDVGTREEDDSD